VPQLIDFGTGTFEHDRSHRIGRNAADAINIAATTRDHVGHLCDCRRLEGGSEYRDSDPVTTVGAVLPSPGHGGNLHVELSCDKPNGPAQVREHLIILDRINRQEDRKNKSAADDELLDIVDSDRVVIEGREELSRHSWLIEA
jgi:hypothetical protein